MNKNQKTRTATRKKTFQNLARTNIERETTQSLSFSLSLSFLAHKNLVREKRPPRKKLIYLSLLFSFNRESKVFSLVREREREFKKNLCVTPLCAFPEEEEDNDQIVA